MFSYFKNTLVSRLYTIEGKEDDLKKKLEYFLTKSLEDFKKLTENTTTVQHCAGDDIYIKFKFLYYAKSNVEVVVRFDEETGKLMLKLMKFLNRSYEKLLVSHIGDDCSIRSHIGHIKYEVVDKDNMKFDDYCDELDKSKFVSSKMYEEGRYFFNKKCASKYNVFETLIFSIGHGLKFRGGSKDCIVPDKQGPIPYEKYKEYIELFMREKHVLGEYYDEDDEDYDDYGDEDEDDEDGDEDEDD